MNARHDGLRTEGARRFFNYWDSLPKKNLVPDRKSFSPERIRDLMRAVTILEIWSRARIDMRLAGTAVCAAMGFDPTGANMLELQAPGTREAYLRLLEEQCNRPCGRRNLLTARHSDGTIVKAEVVTLPMSHEEAGHDMILSYFCSIETVGFGEHSYQILSREATHWIDIGAGVPDWTS
ncbi:MAG TPA: PAS domain-containing protein [Parvibaculum sp.]